MRVLIIFSWDDDVSQRRHERMRRDRRLRSYEIQQAFALPSPLTEPEAGALFAMISTAVDRVKPDILLIHTGAAYHQSPEEFAECLVRLRRAYPELRLGLERRNQGAAVLDQLGVFERSPEMAAVESDFFD